MDMGHARARRSAIRGGRRRNRALEHRKHEAYRDRRPCLPDASRDRAKGDTRFGLGHLGADAWCALGRREGREGSVALFVEAEFERILDPDVDAPLALTDLARRWPDFHWSPQASGIELPTEIAATLETAWAETVGRQISRSAEDEAFSAYEGHLRLLVVRHRRREERLRAAKIAATLTGEGRLVCEVPGCRRTRPGFFRFHLGGESVRVHRTYHSGRAARCKAARRACRSRWYFRCRRPPARRSVVRSVVRPGPHQTSRSVDRVDPGADRIGATRIGR